MSDVLAGSRRRPWSRVGAGFRVDGRRRVLLKAAITLLSAGVAAVVVLNLTVPGSSGAFSAQIRSSTNTVATNAYFQCQGAATGLGAALAWPLDDGYLIGSLTGASDVSGNNRTGLYTPTGVAFRQAGAACPRDPLPLTSISYGAILDGISGYVHYDTAFPLTNTFTEAIWFKTTTTSGGRLIGFGSSPTGASVYYDRMIWMSNSGTVSFGDFPNQFKQLTSASSYNDGRWHQVVASLGASGMRLYVDGAQVASDPSNSFAQVYASNAMYLRVGYDNLNTWTPSPSSYYYQGWVRYAQYFTSQLSSSQVATLYAAGSGA